jgi:hypothetical protein
VAAGARLENSDCPIVVLVWRVLVLEQYKAFSHVADFGPAHRQQRRGVKRRLDQEQASDPVQAEVLD